MVSNHESLSRLIDDERLNITLVMGTARSGSTITALAVGQTHDCILDEPVRDIAKRAGLSKPIFKVSSEQVYEDFCGSVLASVQAKLSVHESVKVLVHECAGVLSEGLFKSWMALPSSTLVTLRDPLTQFVSAAKATVYRANPDIKRAENVMEFIRNSALDVERLQYPDGSGFLAFNQGLWSSLDSELKIISEEQHRRDTNNALRVAYLDTTLLRYDAYTALDATLSQLYLSTNLSWLNEPWKVGVENCRDAKGRPFKERALLSGGIEPLSLRERVEIDALPAASAQHVQGLMGSYEEHIGNAAVAYLPSCEQVVGQRCSGADFTLSECNPILANAIFNVHATKPRAHAYSL